MDDPQLIAAIQDALSRINHAISNPLAIVSGNAQFLLEIGKVMDLDEDFRQSIEDIEEASRRLADLLKKLTELKTRIGEPGVTPDDLADL